MNKIILLYILALTQCHISLSMLTKQIYRASKHIKNIHSKNIALIQGIFKNNPAIDINNMDIDEWDNMDSDEWNNINIYSYYEEELKNLYFRNENIINILTDDIKDTKTVINRLKKQQRLAVLGLANNTDRIHAIEQELHTSFNLKKDNE